MIRPVRSLTLIVFALLLLPVASRGAEDGSLARARRVEDQFAAVIEKVRPAVVSILARGTAPETGEPRMGGGSGVLVSERGLVLTNYHVVGWATSVTVVLAGSRRVPAKILGRDQDGDLALLELEGEGPWPAVEIGESKSLCLGQWVLAMGNPRGTASDGRALVTWGTVTSLHVLGGGSNERTLFYGDAIQTDAEINPGNSGGPLFDLSGRLIGVNGRIATLNRAGGNAVNANVGFAIPASQIRRVLPSLVAGAEIRHGYLGVRVESAAEGGVTVAFVLPDSAADRAGLEVGDRLTRLDGEDISTPERLTNLVSSRLAGYRAAIRIADGEKERVVIVELGTRPKGTS